MRSYYGILSMDMEWQGEQVGVRINVCAAKSVRRLVGESEGGRVTRMEVGWQGEQGEMPISGEGGRGLE